MTTSYSPSYVASRDELSLLLLPPLEALPRRRGVTTMAMLLGDDTRCRYPSKMCRNTRVRKASGALHRYCAYHRNKANANQKRWADRQRASAVSPTASSSSYSSSSSAASSPTYARTKYRWIVAASGKPLAPKPSPEHVKQEPRGLAETEETSAATLTEEDWKSLLSLLVPESPEPIDQCLRIDSLVAAEEAH